METIDAQSMDVFNLSLHIDQPITHDTQVYIATTTPHFVCRKEYDVWRRRVISYVQQRRRSMDLEKELKHKYTIVYVPEAVADDMDEPLSDDTTEEDKVLFIAKRPDDFDPREATKNVFNELQIPGHYAVLVIQSIGDIAEKSLSTSNTLDVVSDSLRVFGWFMLFVAGFVASHFIIKNNPHSVLGL